MSVQVRPHYTLSADVLANWISAQTEKWWSVDGDPVLTSLVDFPCPSDELAPAIRRVGKELVLPIRRNGAQVQGEVIGADDLDRHTVVNRRGRKVLRLTWADSDADWLLLEDEPLG